MSYGRKILQWLEDVSAEEQDVAGSDSEDETVNDTAIDSAHDSESKLKRPTIFKTSLNHRKITIFYLDILREMVQK